MVFLVILPLVKLVSQGSQADDLGRWKEEGFPSLYPNLPYYLELFKTFLEISFMVVYENLRNHVLLTSF
jgi:hypothetical protein